MNEFWNTVLACLTVAVIAYLVGSVNMAILISKYHKSSDIRDFGSGNAGMTNMLRTYGRRAATWTFVGDFAKGALVVFIAREIGKASTIQFDIAYIAALFVMIGHIYPLYFNWVAFVTIAIGIAPMVFIIKIVSAVCLCGASLYPVLNFVVLWLGGRDMFKEVLPYTFLSWLMALLVFYAHRENIKRLRSGTEHSFGRKQQ